MLVVGRVKAGSPAAKRDLINGEVILSLDDTPISTVPEMCAILNSKSSGDTLKVESIPGTAWRRYNGRDIGSFLKAQKAYTTNITLERVRRSGRS